MAYTSILTIDPKLATQIEENLLASFACRSRARQTRLHYGQEIIQFSTKIPHSSPYFNLVLQANFTTPESAYHHIRCLQSKAQARNAPLFWLVGPSTRPLGLGKYLEIYHFTHHTRCSGMVIDLDDLNEESVAPSGLTIEPVRAPRQLRQFVTVRATNAQMPKAVAQAWFEHEASLGLDPELPRQRYLGLWHGQPVATCTTFSGTGVVGLYDLTILPQAKGWAIEMVISLAALHKARRFGQHHGVSIATPVEKNMYRRLGFQAVNEFNLYLWPGQTH
jgi:hypothetical protein